MKATELSFGGSCTKFRVVSQGAGFNVYFFVQKQVFAFVSQTRSFYDFNKSKFRKTKSGPRTRRDL